MAMDDPLDIINHCPLRASLVDDHYSTGLYRLPTYPTLEDFTCLFSAGSPLSFKAVLRYFPGFLKDPVILTLRICSSILLSRRGGGEHISPLFYI
jgi:hypothetical protein